MCEELEYSDLIDSASQSQDPLDRMVYVAAFVISSYSSSYYRTGAKNFNPLLGETYELIRPDKGWKYVAEQVSHHPPISSCHCISKNFVHEQSNFIHTLIKIIKQKSIFMVNKSISCENKILGKIDGDTP